MMTPGAFWSYALTAGLAAYHGSNLLLLLLAWLEIRRQRRYTVASKRDVALDSGLLPGVSIVIPAYNEEITIVRTVQSALAVRYQRLEVIVVSDGSTDLTVDALWHRYGLQPTDEQPSSEIPTQRVLGVFRSRVDPRLVVLDKKNGGKADALNAGICFATHPLVLAVDADVVLQEDALLHLALPFVLDRRIRATSGLIRPQNGNTIEAGRLTATGLPSGWLEAFQTLEYMRAYSIGRVGFDRLNAQLIISGAFGLFDRSLILRLEGYQPHAVGEDMELVVRAHRLLRSEGTDYRVAFAVDALCLTEAPHTFGTFGGQRTRWHQGLLSTLRLHKDMAFRPAWGSIGLIAFPYYLLELFAPVLEGAGWLALPLLWAGGAIGSNEITLFVGVSVLMSGSVSVFAVWLDAAYFKFFVRVRDRLILCVLALLEQVGYRQLTVYYRLRAFVRYYWKVQLKSGWKPPARKRHPSGGAGP